MLGLGSATISASSTIKTLTDMWLVESIILTRIIWHQESAEDKRILWWQSSIDTNPKFGKRRLSASQSIKNHV